MVPGISSTVKSLLTAMMSSNACDKQSGTKKQKKYEIEIVFGAFNTFMQIDDSKKFIRIDCGHFKINRNAINNYPNGTTDKNK